MKLFWTITSAKIAADVIEGLIALVISVIAVIIEYFANKH
jgi:hypothetical protein